MKITKLSFLGLFLLLLAVFIVLKMSRKPSMHDITDSINSSPIERNQVASYNDSSSKTGEIKIDAQSTTLPTPMTVEQICEIIHDASVTYDPKELATIQPFLLHQDPAIRKAAIDGMIVLGDASAGVMLRDAAKGATSPQEAVAMLEAADYVELPSATNVLRLKKKTSQQDGAPNLEKPIHSRGK